MPGIPGGTVTFLFTDIEGSTVLWEKNAADMASALARHDALLRGVIGRHEGHVFKTMGDAFCAAFHTAPAAVEAAIAAQQELGREQWPGGAQIRVRMALHTGAAESRDNDYFGQPLNRVARLLSAGHGGQILLSLATQELVRDQLPATLALRDMGERRLKDLIRPERVYQLHARDSAAEFPPLKTLDARAHNLPIQLTSFVGREREMREVKGMLEASRLVTLTGSGGAGKTRLSLQIAADLIDDFSHGVWLVELAALTDPRLVVYTIAAAIGVKEEAGQPMIDTLVRATREREMLLILDNCEHVIDAAAQVSQRILEGGARIRILASSREAMRLPGEAVYRVPSLSVPDPKAPIRIQALTQYAAVQLFIDRATTAKASFRIDNDNAPAVASICHRLDGIPLALELAAARVRALLAEEINRRLDQRFRLLTGGSRASLPRQQTLRALVDWSYDLLEPNEKTLLCRQAVFAGGWSLEDAERVCSDEAVGDADVLDLLGSLVDKSLVVADEDRGATRYRLLETVLQYAGERLDESGQRRIWESRHLAHFSDLAQEAGLRLTGPDQQLWLDRLDLEHDNLRAALGRACATSADAETGLCLAAAIWLFWGIRGYLREGLEWLDRLLAATAQQPQDAVRGKALNGAGVLATKLGDYAGASRRHVEALAIRRGLADPRAVASSLNNLAIAKLELGLYAEAGALHAESLVIREQSRDLLGIAQSKINLGWVAYYQLNYTGARSLNEEGLAMARGLGNQSVQAVALNNLGLIAFAVGEHDGAAGFYRESLKLQQDLGDRAGIAGLLEGLAYLAVPGQPERAVRLIGAAQRLRAETAAPLSSNDRPQYELHLAALKQSLGEGASFQSAWEEGEAMPLESAIQYAMEDASAGSMFHR